MVDAARPDPVVAARERACRLVGRTLSDRYRIVELIAMGGMGAVYRAEHLTMRKLVAVKVLHPDVEGFPDLVARFEREAVAGAHIRHRNVATASDFGTFDGGSKFLVLEHIEGRTLRDFIDRGPVPPLRACRIARHVASGLAAVHAKGIVHRDLKPANVLLVDATRETFGLALRRKGETDVVKLIDFGLAKVPVGQLSALAQDADLPHSALTRAGVVVGTRGYLAPEAALGTTAITARSDLYALGVILFEMLCGEPPFRGATAAALFAAHRTQPVPRLEEVNPNLRVPPRVEAVVRSLLAKDPADRPRDARALIDALDAAMRGAPADPEPAPEPLPPPPASRSTLAMRPERTWRSLALAAVVVAGGALLIFATTTGSAPASATTAWPAASGAPSARSSAAPAPPSALVELRRAAASHDHELALAALVDAMRARPEAFASRALQNEVATIVETAAEAGVDVTAPLRRITNELGASGVDILYDLLARERMKTAPARDPLVPPSSAGAKARALLADEAVRARGDKALRVAYDLLVTPCLRRPLLFPRAATEGDDRALEVLRSMQLPVCQQETGCCYPTNVALERAIVDIEARLRR